MAQDLFRCGWRSGTDSGNIYHTLLSRHAFRIEKQPDYGSFQFRSNGSRPGQLAVRLTRPEGVWWILVLVLVLEPVLVYGVDHHGVDTI